MKIQSASIDIPGGCPNDCKYCISSMTANKEFSRNVIGSEDRVFVVRQLDDRLQFLRDIGVSSLVITGAKSEPVFNRGTDIQIHLKKEEIESLEKIAKQSGKRHNELVKEWIIEKLKVA